MTTNISVHVYDFRSNLVEIYDYNSNNFMYNWLPNRKKLLCDNFDTDIFSLTFHYVKKLAYHFV